jgi:DNA-binding NarL/FixJ family response regulator
MWAKQILTAGKSGRNRMTAGAPSADCGRLLVVDDHPIVRCGLVQLLEGEHVFDELVEAGGIQEAINALTGKTFDLAIVDISLGDGNGLELVTHIRQRHPDTKVLVWSMHDDLHFVELALRGGALGYVTKTEARANIVEAIQRVMEGRIYVSDTMNALLLQSRIGQTPRSPIERLSNREMQVFERIGQGLSTREIAEQLQVSQKTVETHRERIKAKLHAATGMELARQAFHWVANRR